MEEMIFSAVTGIHDQPRHTSGFRTKANLEVFNQRSLVSF